MQVKGCQIKRRRLAKHWKSPGNQTLCCFAHLGASWKLTPVIKLIFKSNCRAILYLNFTPHLTFYVTIWQVEVSPQEKTPLSRWSFPFKGNKSWIRNWAEGENIHQCSKLRLAKVSPFYSSANTMLWRIGIILNGWWASKTWSNRRLGWPRSAACGLGKAW